MGKLRTHKTRWVRNDSGKKVLQQLVVPENATDEPAHWVNVSYIPNHDATYSQDKIYIMIINTVSQ